MRLKAPARHQTDAPGNSEQGGYVATLSRRLAEAQARRFAVKLCEPPFSLGKRSTRMLWRERSEVDTGGRFFRNLVGEAASE